VDDLMNYLSAHPVVLIVIIAVAVILLYLALRKTLKLILITALVGIVLGLAALYGYHYYSGEPERFPESVKEVVGTIGDQSEKMIEAGKDVVEKVGESIKEKRNPTDGK